MFNWKRASLMLTASLCGTFVLTALITVFEGCFNIAMCSALAACLFGAIAGGIDLRVKEAL